MANNNRPSTSRTSVTTSYPGRSTTSATPRPTTSRSTIGRSRGRPQTTTSTTGGNQQLICAISESRGISPVVGLAFVNLSTSEAVLCQISDNQAYVRTIQKLSVYEPSELLVMNTAAQPKSKMYLALETTLPGLRMITIDRKYWSETAGIEYIQQLAFKEDVEAIKVSVEGSFYAICCIAAVRS